MTDARATHERLPWLDPVPRAAPPSSAAARRARTPLIVLLALLVGGGVAVMAFLVGRGTAPPVMDPAPIAATRPIVKPLPVPIPLPVPLPPVPPTLVNAPPPASAAPTSSATQPAAQPIPQAAASLNPASLNPAASRALPTRRQTSTPPSVRIAKGVRIHRNTPRARRYAWPAQAVNRPSGRVVQLGAYRTPAEVGAAWRRLVRAYPYLARLPRRVVVVGPGAGRPLYYRLRIGARSPRSARGLCTELHRRGRGCIVV